MGAAGVLNSAVQHPLFTIQLDKSKSHLKCVFSWIFYFKVPKHWLSLQLRWFERNGASRGRGGKVMLLHVENRWHSDLGICWSIVMSEVQLRFQKTSSMYSCMISWLFSLLQSESYTFLSIMCCSIRAQTCFMLCWNVEILILALRVMLKVNLTDTIKCVGTATFVLSGLAWVYRLS